MLRNLPNRGPGRTESAGVAEAAAGEHDHTEPMSSTRLARKQVVFREVNARLRSIAHALPDGTTDYLCECSGVHCTEKIGLRLPEYERVRAHPDTFFVVPGHELLEVERVIERNARFAVVLKLAPLAHSHT